MYWEEFLKSKVSYQDVWQEMKGEYLGDMRKFLDRAYIVVCYDCGQVSFDADALSIAMDHANFFMADRHLTAYFKLVEELKRVEHLPDGKKKAVVIGKLREFDIKKLSVQDNWAEVRFCTVDMPKIQLLKESKFCDQALTDKSRASIRVILKRS